jgi:large subunit ribosomal protein L6
MSRIGNAPITVPEGVEVNVSAENIVVVKGKLGELSQTVHPDIKVAIVEGILTLSRSNDDKDMRSLHGLYRALISNMIEGVSNGYVIEQELIGVG